MTHHIETLVPGVSRQESGKIQPPLHLVQAHIIGKIEPGREVQHAVPDVHTETMKSFNAMVEMLYAPVMDGDDDNATVVDTVGRVEIHTSEGEEFLITRGKDDQNNPTAAVLTHDGRHEHDHALVSIDAGEKGLYTEQHRFRYSNGKLIESYSDPIRERDYTQVFDNLIDLVMSGEATIVANP